MPKRKRSLSSCFFFAMGEVCLLKTREEFIYKNQCNANHDNEFAKLCWPGGRLQN